MKTYICYTFFCSRFHEGKSSSLEHLEGFFYPINLISLNWNFPNLSSRLRITPPPLRVAPLDSSKGRGDFLKDLGIANGQPFETLGITDYIFGRKNKVFKPLISWSQMAGVGFIHQDLAYSTWKMRIPKTWAVDSAIPDTRTTKASLVRC